MTFHHEASGTELVVRGFVRVSGMDLRGITLALMCLGSIACADSLQQSAQQDRIHAQAALRRRPRRSAARRALREAARQARACLQNSVERAEVAGAFVGRTGRYSVESVLGVNIDREQRECIRAAFEGARVMPFRQESYEMTEVVSRTEPTGGGDTTSSGAEAGLGASDSGVVTSSAMNSSGSTGEGTVATAANAASAATTAMSATSANAPMHSRSANAGPSVTGRAGESSGGIEHVAVANIMRTRTDVVRDCYQNQLMRDPSLRAQVRVRFTIDAAGLVTQASSTAVAEQGDLDRVSDLARCLEGVVRGTSFPAREGGSPAEVSMSFVFAPGTPSATGATTSVSGSRGAASAMATPGMLDRDRVAATIRARMPSLSACYQRASQQERHLAGRVSVRFVVDTNGRVRDVQTSPVTHAGNPARMSDVARCVQSVFFGFVFDPPTGGAAAAVLPLDFGPTS